MLGSLKPQLTHNVDIYRRKPHIPTLMPQGDLRHFIINFKLRIMTTNKEVIVTVTVSIPTPKRTKKTLFMPTTMTTERTFRTDEASEEELAEIARKKYTCIMHASGDVVIKEVIPYVAVPLTREEHEYLIFK